MHYKEVAKNHIKRNIESVISDKEKRKISRRIIEALFAAAFLISGLIFKNLYPAQDGVSGVIFMAGVIVGSAATFGEAFKDLLKSKYTMEQLVAIAITASVLIGKYETAILIPVILSIVHFIEERSILGGKDAIESLKKIQAKKAILLSGDIEQEVAVETLEVGNTILVKPGMTIAIDGVIVGGTSSVDQKSLTGESNPRDVKKGDNVYAGTVNTSGLLTVMVEKVVADTSFSKILQLLEKAERTTLPIIGILDKFYVYYIPFVIIVALICAIVFQDITRAVAVLVASCPCAYIMVSSSAMIAAIAASSKQGILIKDSSFIETLSTIDTIIFDKTGTLTEGGLFVERCILNEAKTDNELLESAAHVARGSMHPVSKAIISRTGSLNNSGYEIKEVAGGGLEGFLGDETIYLGNRGWLISKGFKIGKNPENNGPISWVVKNNRILGCILFSDRIRKDAATVISNLKEMGLDQSILLSGDSKGATEAIKQELGIDKAFAELLPDEKQKYVKQEKDDNRKVMVIGDGINDALALKEADIGIAMGAMGSDTAINSADIALMNNSLQSIPFIIGLAGKTKSVIYQNIIIALVSGFVMISLAFAGIITPVWGTILHNIGTFIVLINSAKLLLVRKK